MTWRRSTKGADDGDDRGAAASDPDPKAREIAAIRAGLVAYAGDVSLTLNNPSAPLSGPSGPGLSFRTWANNPFPIAAGGSGEDSRLAAGPGLEVVEQAEPIRAWRALRLGTEGNTVTLESMNSGRAAFLAEEQEAGCYRGHGLFGAYHQAQSLMGIRSGSVPTAHVAPAEGCECGFYAVKDIAHVMESPFIAEVDLYGKVIEHDLGYRAQFQRVLSVRLNRPELCLGRFLCDGAPEHLWFPDGRDPVVVCSECVRLAGAGQKMATLAQLAARLGVEVRWA